MFKQTILVAAVVGLVLALGTAAWADTYDWTRDGASDTFEWDEGNGDNWNPDTGTGYPNAIGDVANMRNSYQYLSNIQTTDAWKQEVLIDRDITVGTILLGMTWNSNPRAGQIFTINAGFRLIMDDLDDVAEIQKNDSPHNAGVTRRFPITFQGAGTIELNDDLVIANEGTLSGRRLQFDVAITENGGPFDVTKTGPGIVIFGGNNTYTGDTKVNEGELTLTNLSALAGSSLDVSGAGTVQFGVTGTNTYNLGGLKGQGSINAGTNTLKVKSLSPGNSVGQLTVSNPLDISAIIDTEKLVFELGADTTAGTTYDHVSMAGKTLTLGTLNFADFTFTTVAGFDAGVYTLFDAGSITGSIGTADGTIGGLAAKIGRASCRERV